MSKLTIRKANALPAIIEPSTLYYIRVNNTNIVMLYLSDKEGNITYHTYGSSEIIEIINTVITSQLDQPGGISSIDINGKINGVNKSLKLNSMVITANIEGEQNIIIPTNVNLESCSLYINGLYQQKLYNLSVGLLNIPSTFEIKENDVITLEYYLNV